jgi:hypothetical protein
MVWDRASMRAVQLSIGDFQSPPNFAECATGGTGKIVAASATVALNNIYHAFLILQSYICNVSNLFIQKENG